MKSLSDGSFDTRIESVSLEHIRCQKLLGAIVLNNREKKRWCSVEMTSECSWFAARERKERKDGAEMPEQVVQH